jgi:hypothetical protein
MSVSFINWTSRVAIAGRVAERRRPKAGTVVSPRRLSPALRQGRGPGRSGEVDLAGVITTPQVEKAPAIAAWAFIV